MFHKETSYDKKSLGKIIALLKIFYEDFMFDIFSKTNNTWKYLGNADKDNGDIVLFIDSIPKDNKLIIIEKEELFNLNSKKINLQE